MRILVGHLVSFMWVDTAIFSHGSDTPVSCSRAVRWPPPLSRRDRPAEMEAA
jgi:hypothetical protein